MLMKQDIYVSQRKQVGQGRWMRQHSPERQETGSKITLNLISNIYFPLYVSTYQSSWQILGKENAQFKIV